MLTVCTSSTWSDLTDLDSVQEVLNAPSSEEAYLARLISRASRMAENYVGYPLLRATYFESVSGAGGKALMVSRMPVTSVTKIIEGSSSTADGTVLTSTEYTIEDADAGLIRREGFAFQWQPAETASIALGFAPGSETRNYWVEYTAGYIYRGSVAEARTLPEDIEQAVIDKVQQLYNGDGLVASKKLGDYAVTYRSDTVDVAFAPIEQYVRIA